MDPSSGASAAGSSWVYRLAWIFYLILALGGALWIGLREGAIPLSTFVDTERWWLDLGLGASAGGVLIALWQAARRLSASASRLENELSELLGNLDQAEVLGLALLSGFAEELFFRGAVQSAWGWVPATLLFALLHAGPGSTYRIWTGFAALAGLLFAWLMLWRGNLTAPIVAHALVNGVNLSYLGRLQAGAGPSPENPT